MTTAPSSIRFSRDVKTRLEEYVARRLGESVSSATNRLVDEALRMEAHRQIAFADGPLGRRAVVVGGPDVWEVAKALESARDGEPGLSESEVIDLVTDSAGIRPDQVQAAISYWAEFPDEVDAMLRRARQAAEESEARWLQERKLLAR